MSTEQLNLLWTGGLLILAVILAGYILKSLQEWIDNLRAKRMGQTLYKKNRQGVMVDVNGYDLDGFHWETGLDSQGYDAGGFNEEGYDRSGFNRRRFDAWGNHESGARFSDTTGLDAKGKDIHGQMPRTDDDMAAALMDYLAKPVAFSRRGTAAQ